jgi:mono/diheme cytochrome c family protein
MKRRYLSLAAALVFTASFGGWIAMQSMAQTDINQQPLYIAEGERLYQSNCASCHGANLEGQPNWRSPGPDSTYPAPPHDETGHTWHHADSVLLDYTKLGGKAALALQGVEFESGMPGFGSQLTDTQIQNILDYIKTTWPDRQRELQAERSVAERQPNEN